MDLLQACTYEHQRYVLLFEDVGSVFRVDASLNAYCDDSECYILSNSVSINS